MKQNTRLNYIFVLVLITTNLAVFLPSMKGDFLWDDKYFISENPYIQGPHFLKNVLITPFGGLSGTDENSSRLDRSRQFYRPLSSLSYWLDRKLWGFNPAGFHLTNILLQIINTILLFLILLNLGLKPVTSFFCSMLFSVFPFHFENVSWISGRTDLLSFLFAAFSVLFFLKFLKRKNYVFLTLSSLLYLFSLFSKENNILLILVYFFILYAKEPKFKLTVISMIPFGLGSLVWLTLRSITLGGRTFEYSGRTLFDFLATIGFYSIRIFIPFNLSFTVDSYDVFKSIAFQILGLIIFLLFILSSILLLKKRLKEKTLTLVFFSFCLLLLPSVVIIFSSTTSSLIAWRFLYLPSALFVSYLVYSIFKKIKHRYLSIILLSMICLVYTAEIYPKNRAFGKSETDFWLSFKKIEREDLITKYNVGVTYLPQDDKKAIEIFNDILSQKRHHRHEVYEVKIYESLAQYYTFKKNFKMAENYFNKLLKIRRYQSQHFHFTYAFFLAFQGKISDGEKIVSEMLNVFPKNHLVLVHAARFYIIIENYEKAVELLTKDYNLFPTRETLRLLNKLEEERKKTTSDSLS